MLTKAEREEIRARVDAATKGPWVENPAYESMVSATERWTSELLDASDEPLIVDLDRRGPDREFVRYARTDVPALLDALDAQDAEIQRLTAENDRLIATQLADQWQGRYWDERNKVADREATIMAERATAAALRKALEATVAAWVAEYLDFFGDAPPGAENIPAIVNARAALQSPDPGKALLDAHAAELKEIGEQLEADRTATADGVTVIKRAVASRRWLTEDGRGSYEWDDDRYRGEFRQAVAEIETALEPLAKIAADWQNCPRTGPAIVEARQDLKSTNVVLRQRAEAAETALRRIVSRRTESMTEATYAYCCELAERALGGEGK